MIANPVPWPNGARCTVAFTFDMDADSNPSGQRRFRVRRLVNGGRCAVCARKSQGACGGAAEPLHSR